MALRSDVSSHAIHQLSCNVEAQAGAFDVRCVSPHPVKWLKQLRDVFAAQTVPAVGGLDEHVICLLSGANLVCPHGGGFT